MPGRTAADAFRMFVEPLQDALACLGTAKITTSPGGRGTRGNPADGYYLWSINGFDGISQGPLTLRASMEYRFIDRRDDAKVSKDERWKVRTRNYIYKFSFEGHDVVDWHWHPESTLDIRFPHLHLAGPAISKDGVVTARHHIPTGRTAFEGVVRYLIREQDWKPRVADWEQRLTLREDIFRLYSSWAANPPPAPEAAEATHT